MLKISILTIGDEICIGQIVNTNASWIASQCTRLGCSVLIHSTIGDEKEIILNELERLLKFSDIVITTGGLGPTHDDITKPTLCEFFNDELILHEPTLNRLEDFFSKRGYKLTERNKSQAEIPSKCIPLTNNIGTAPGLQFEKDGKYTFSVPGVPAEMKYIMENSILPFIQNLVSESKTEVVIYKLLQTSGIPEAMLADLIGEPSDFLNKGTLAFLPYYQGVKLRIGVSGSNFQTAKEELARIENIIRSRVSKFIFGEGDDSISSSVGKLLKEYGKTLSVAESCTGGLLGGEITHVSGSSNYFSGGAIVYSNEAKINILKVREETIEKYGAVSEQTALELAQNVRTIFNTDFGVSVTGVAGPTGGTSEKPVGTVWIGIADEKGVEAKKYVFGDERRVNRERTVGTALTLLYKKLKEINH